ncbi:hypothetical protein K438DRAFT_1782411 [Mycena galopus ATCC 62051]|nr:hypothetical protein K438DRAFT_1782411 [Mycena galopus ATCC 62051]
MYSPNPSEAFSVSALFCLDHPDRSPFRPASARRSQCTEPPSFTGADARAASPERTTPEEQGVARFEVLVLSQAEGQEVRRGSCGRARKILGESRNAVGVANPADAPRIPGKEDKVSTLKRCRRGSLEEVAWMCQEVRKWSMQSSPWVRTKKSSGHRLTDRKYASEEMMCAAWLPPAYIFLLELAELLASAPRFSSKRACIPPPPRSGPHPSTRRAAPPHTTNPRWQRQRSSARASRAPALGTDASALVRFDFDAATTDKEIVSPAPRRAALCRPYCMYGGQPRLFECTPTLRTGRATHAVQRDDVHFHLRQGGGVGTRGGGARSPRREAGGAMRRVDRGEGDWMEGIGREG